MEEHRLTVPRTARYYMLGGAAAGGGAPPGEAWITCHGYGQLAARFLRGFEPVAGPERLVVAPGALSRFYLDDALRVPGPVAGRGARGRAGGGAGGGEARRRVRLLAGRGHGEPLGRAGRRAAGRADPVGRAAAAGPGSRRGGAALGRRRAAGDAGGRSGGWV